MHSAQYVLVQKAGPLDNTQDLKFGLHFSHLVAEEKKKEIMQEKQERLVNKNLYGALSMK